MTPKEFLIAIIVLLAIFLGGMKAIDYADGWQFEKTQNVTEHRN